MTANDKLFKILLEKDPLGTATEYSFTREELEAIYEEAYAETEQRAEDRAHELWESESCGDCWDKDDRIDDLELQLAEAEDRIAELEDAA